MEVKELTLRGIMWGRRLWGLTDIMGLLPLPLGTNRKLFTTNDHSEDESKVIISKVKLVEM